MRKVAVIGGSGFIGTRLCDRLVNLRDIGFIILDVVVGQKYVEYTKEGDVRNVDSLRDVLRDVDVIVNLAAEHKDNVRPTSAYYDVNVGGAENIVLVAQELGIKRLIFTSSVAVYGFVTSETFEDGDINPFNDYGISKWKAEQCFRAKEEFFDQLVVIRPTVVFGEGNRGNVYNLLKQIVSGVFIMIGSGRNKKSMAYVENIADFIAYFIANPDYSGVYNYADKPDLTMTELVAEINFIAGVRRSRVRIPYAIGIVLGWTADLISRTVGIELPVSAVRIKKFCATTQFGSNNVKNTKFKPRVLLSDALKATITKEFL